MEKNGQYPIFKDGYSAAGRSISRVINQRAIVDRIYQNNGISKAQLAKELGISKPAISSHVANLISLGIILERGEGQASVSGGRKPVMLYCNENYRYAGVLDLSLKNPVCTVCDLKYNIIGLEEIKLDGTASLEEWRQCIKQAFLKIFSNADVSAEKLGIMIISQPGVSNDGMNTDYVGARHHAIDPELRLFLQQVFSVPVFIKNNVNLAAVGELNFGLEEHLDNIVYISCGVGLDAGIILRGELYEGCHRAAGEIGYLLRYDGRHVEDGVTADALVASAEKLYAENGKNEKITFPLLVERLQNDDPFIKQAVHEAGKELGRIIQNCCVLLDISTVIFGGEYLELGSVLFNGMRDFEETTIARHELIPSTLRDAASLYGGFVIGIERILSVLSDNKIEGGRWSC